jgi:pyridoxal phosphate enzyme (YggS family)
MGNVAANYRALRSAVDAAARERKVTIVGATKMVTPNRIQEAIGAGMRIFGENRVQEAAPKIEALSGFDIEWHFIGHLQSNKVALAVRHFACIQSVDSGRLLRSIEDQAGRQRKQMRLMLEVNLGGEESKHGLAPEDLAEVLRLGAQMRWCGVVGLMAIPPFFENPEEVRPFFRRLRELRDLHHPEFPSLTELSMGMSHDCVIAVEEGATMVRVGTALFGERPPRRPV